MIRRAGGTQLLVLFMIHAAPFLSAQLPAVDSSKNHYIPTLDQHLSAGVENLQVFNQWLKWQNPGHALINHLNQQAASLLDQRSARVAKLATPADWRKRQKQVRATLNDLLGPWPDRAPLKAQVTGVLHRDGFRVEKIIYEAFPGAYVPACLFIPTHVSGKMPAVLNVFGHNQESFRAELYQAIIQNLVKKGIMVLAIDPISQGEHVQHYDSALKFSKVGYSVEEHCYSGNQCFLTGTSLAKYFIWEAMCGIDYLCSRPDVDPNRLGMTGFSGGGTITTYVMALDERVKVAVPCSWSTASRRQLETKGAQDAEANLFHSMKLGLTVEDLIELRAPKPTLLTFVTRDEYLSHQGAVETFQEARQAYTALGAQEHLQWVEDNSPHWMTLKIRETIYAFFMQHFGLSGPAKEEAYVIIPEKELQVTKNGQIALDPGGSMIFDVHKPEAERLLAQLDQQRVSIRRHLYRVVHQAKKISGYINPPTTGVKAFMNGRYQREGYTISKLAIAGEGDYLLPFLLFKPDGQTFGLPVVIYIHPQGKSAQAGVTDDIARMVNSGVMVAAIDLPGSGELGSTAGRPITAGYTAVLIGRSVVAIQAADLSRLVMYLHELPEVDKNKIALLALGRMTIPAVHAAAFDRRINAVLLHEMPISYRSMVLNRDITMGLTPRSNGGYWHPYEVDFDWGVAGALHGYDLPDLIGCIAPRRVFLSSLLDQQLKPATVELINQELHFPRQAYQQVQAVSQLRVADHYSTWPEVIRWCFED